MEKCKSVIAKGIKALKYNFKIKNMWGFNFRLMVSEVLDFQVVTMLGSH